VRQGLDTHSDLVYFEAKAAWMTRTRGPSAGAVPEPFSGGSLASRPYVAAL
jgi:hypothetical protein